MSAGDIIYVFVVLTLLLAGVYIVVYFMKKAMFRFDSSAMQNVSIDLISVRGIMPKKYIGIVKVNNDFYLIGISENNITKLDKLDSEQFADIEFNSPHSETKFAGILKKAFNKEQN